MSKLVKNATHSIVAVVCCVVLGFAGACGSSQSSSNSTSNSSSTGTSSSSSSSSSSNSSESSKLTVVASVNQWGSLAAELGGDEVAVTSIINSTAVEAHDYEATTADIANIEKADILIVNGAGYDAWATKTKTNAQSTINAASIMGASTGDNAHLWFSKDTRSNVAKSITEAYAKAKPSKKKYFTKLLTAWKTEEATLDKTIAQFKTDHSDTTYAATESVAYYLAEDLGMEDVTPEGYSNASNNDSEPSSSDLQKFQALIENHKADLLINNSQEASDTTNLLTGTAGKSDVPVVDVSEQMPSNYKTLADWITALISDFETALNQSAGSESE